MCLPALVKFGLFAIHSGQLQMLRFFKHLFLAHIHLSVYFIGEVLQIRQQLVFAENMQPLVAISALNVQGNENNESYKPFRGMQHLTAAIGRIGK